MQAAELTLDRDGAQLLAGLALPLLDELTALADRLPQGRAGSRIVGDAALAALLSPSGRIGREVARIAGGQPTPVRAILFDKHDEANWGLGWHQDRTIAVQHRVEAAGYGPWTIKQGIVHVEPPFELFERMTTVRIHLDPVDADNAPLLIALGSHLGGRIPFDGIAAAIERTTSFACRAEAGDVWLYSTPILHASKPAAPGRHRRVLQADYAEERLPSGLEWLGI